MTNPPSTPDGTTPEPPSGTPKPANPTDGAPTWGSPASPAAPQGASDPSASTYPGQNPQAQYQPQGQYPPPGQAQFPPAGQAQYPPAAVPAPKNSRAKAILGILVAVAAVFAVKLLIASFMNRSMVDSMNVGDCVKKQGADEIVVVACTDTTADYKILKIVTGTTDDAQCPAESMASYIEYDKSGKSSSSDRLVCLGNRFTSP